MSDTKAALASLCTTSWSFIHFAVRLFLFFWPSEKFCFLLWGIGRVKRGVGCKRKR